MWTVFHLYLFLIHLLPSQLQLEKIFCKCWKTWCRADWIKPEPMWVWVRDPCKPSVEPLQRFPTKGLWIFEYTILHVLTMCHLRIMWVLQKRFFSWYMIHKVKSKLCFFEDSQTVYITRWEMLGCGSNTTDLTKCFQMQRIPLKLSLLNVNSHLLCPNPRSHF